VDFFTEIEDREQTGTVYRQTGQGLAFEVGQLNMLGGVQAEVSPDGRTVNNDNALEPIDVADIMSLGLEIEYDLDWGTFTSLTGFKDHDYSYVEDFDGSPVHLFMYGQDQKGDYFEQELRLTSNTDGPLSWYAGVSFYKENIDTTFLGQQSEDAYCAGYWGYYANYYDPGSYSTCQSVFDYYNYLGPPGYVDGEYYWNAYYLYYYLGGTGVLGDADYAFTPSANGLMNDRNRIIGKYQGYSAYVDLSYEFSDTFDVSLGVRYSKDEKKFSQEVLEDPGGTGMPYRVQTGFSTSAGPLTGKEDWSEVTYRLIGNWHVSESSLIYGSVTEGYKPGGFGSFTADGPSCDDDTPWGLCDRIAGVDSPDTFGPETVTSYEVGYKGTVMGGRTQISASAFFYDYEDMQALFEEGARQVIDNVGQIDGQGFEAEVRTALGDNVSLQLGLSWFDSEATGVQKFCGNGAILARDDLFDHEDPGDENVCEGESIPWAPEWTAFAVLSAHFPMGNGEMFGNLAWSWEEDYRGDWVPRSLAIQRIAALNQTDFVVGYRAENWSVRAYVENVFDNTWYDGNYPDETDPLAIYTQHAFGPSRPRTSGVRFSYEF
jgi:iron complex outermembrane receptor protein